MSNISILVSCHKPVEVVPSEIIKPIQVGCALNEKRLKVCLEIMKEKIFQLKIQITVN